MGADREEKPLLGEGVTCGHKRYVYFRARTDGKTDEGTTRVSIIISNAPRQ